MQTERLVIRRFRPDDAPIFVAYRSDPDIARYQSWTAPYPETDAARVAAASAADDPAAPGWFQYALARREDDLLIGDIGVCTHENGMQAEIGFTLASSWQGHGYAFEAVHRMLEHLFTERHLHRVSAECDARNVSSAKLLRRLGFTQEGCRREHTFMKGEWTDDLLFGLLASQWPSRR